MTWRSISSAAIGWGLAVALSSFGCSSNGKNGNAYPGDANREGQPPAAGATAGTSDTSARADRDQSPITLTGCLQKGDGRTDYILTEVNSPRTSVGTSGSTAAPGNATATSGKSSASSGGNTDAVGQEQMRAAEHAYRLNGDRDSLEPLVGKQVRVSGTLAARSDLNAHDDQGKLKDRDRTKIDEDDLAKVDVASIDSVSDNCGGKAGRKSNRK